MLDGSQANLAVELPALTQRQQLDRISLLLPYLSLVLSLSAGVPGRERPDYGRVLAIKGLTAEAAAARRGGLVEGPARALAVEVAGARFRLQGLTQQRVPPERADEHARAIRRAVDDVDAKETALARAVAWRPTLPTPEQVAAALPAGAALVDFVRYIRSDPPVKGKHGFRWEARYAAFVVRRGAQPRRVEVGKAGDIDEALAAWRARLQREGADTEEAGRKVFTLVWKPIEPLLEGVRTIFMAPDGELNFLPWGALPDEQDGSFLLLRRAFLVVGSGRQLVRLAAAQRPAAGGLLAAGGVDYGQAEDGHQPVPGAPTLAASRSRAATRGSLSFEELPATKAEAEAVATLYRRHEPREGIEPLEGRGATRDRLRAAMGGRRYLHLATHGYFAPPELKSALAPRDDAEVLRTWEAMGQRGATGWFPELLSGLAWAGANRPAPDPAGGVDVGTGIMTAEEVGGLDLKGCELAVLSACETGLGVERAGLGIASLQKAMQMAGARSVITSLWKVPDEATRELMLEFYRRLWVEKEPKGQALWEAKKELRDARDEGGHRKYTTRDWAAWVLTGNPD